MYVSYMFFIVFPQFSNQWFIFISVTFFPKQSKNDTKFHFQFRSTSALDNSQFPVHLNSKHQTAEQYQGSDDCCGIDLNTVLNLRIQVNYFNPVLYTVSVSDCPSPERGKLYIFIGDLISKISLLLFTILSASKYQFKKRPVIGNHIKWL